MKTDERNKLERIGNRHDTHADFDGVLARYTGKIIAPQTRGRRILEAGCSTGVITEMLLEYAGQLDVVEGSASYAEIVENKFHGRLHMYRSLFEEFHPVSRYETVVFAGVLHHLEEPASVLKMVAEWVEPAGIIHVSVPNMDSFHRRLGVAMGVAASTDEASERNRFFEQPGRFTRERLLQAVAQAGLEVLECFGFFFKPFPHEIMNKLNLPDALLDGLFEMGKQYPDLACQLYLRARRI